MCAVEQKIALEIISELLNPFDLLKLAGNLRSIPGDIPGVLCGARYYQTPYLNTDNDFR